MAQRSLRRPFSRPQFPLFRPSYHLAKQEIFRTPLGAPPDYQEIRLQKWDWEELLDLFRAQSAILKILETKGHDPNSGARELLRMQLQSFQRLLERLMGR